MLAFDRDTGRLLWQQTVVTAPLEAKNAENSYAAATPATDGKNVYVTFLDRKEVVVAAYDFSGKQLWIARPGEFYSQWGFSHNPNLFEDKLIVVCDSKGENFIAALDRAAGRTVWKVQRDNPSQSYKPAADSRAGGRPQMVVAGNKACDHLRSSHGKASWLDKAPASDSVAISDVLMKSGTGVEFARAGPRRALLADQTRRQRRGDPNHVAWTTTEGAPYVPSPISAGDWFFTSSYSTKEAHCYEARSGTVLWREKIGLCHASPVSANGLLYFLNDDGVTWVLKAGPQAEVVARNELGEKTYASPAISEGRIFLRGFITCTRSAANSRHNAGDQVAPRQTRGRT